MRTYPPVGRRAARIKSAWISTAWPTRRTRGARATASTGEDNQLSRRVVFGGNGNFARATEETSAYVQDSWRIRPSLLVDLGLRYDRDGLVGNHNVSPRFGFGWSPPGEHRQRISGGSAVIYDASSLRLFTRPLDQFSITSTSITAARSRAGRRFRRSIDPALRLRSPRYQSWTLGLEQRLPGNFPAARRLAAPPRARRLHLAGAPGARRGGARAGTGAVPPPAARHRVHARRRPATFRFLLRHRRRSFPGSTNSWRPMRAGARFQTP